MHQCPCRSARGCLAAVLHECCDGGDALESLETTCSVQSQPRRTALWAVRTRGASTVTEGAPRPLPGPLISGSEAIMPSLKSACQTFCSAFLGLLHLWSNTTHQSVQRPLVEAADCLGSVQNIDFYPHCHVFSPFSAVGMACGTKAGLALLVIPGHIDPLTHLAGESCVGALNIHYICTFAADAIIISADLQANSVSSECRCYVKPWVTLRYWVSLCTRPYPSVLELVTGMLWPT